jgi:ribosomal protein L10
MSKYANMKDYGKFELKAGVKGDQIFDVQVIAAKAKIPPKKGGICLQM